MNNMYPTCPANMADGRGVNTSFTLNTLNNQNLKKEFGVTDGNAFRTLLQSKSPEDMKNISNFGCDPDPHGEVNVSVEINLDNGDNTQSFLDQFKLQEK